MEPELQSDVLSWVQIDEKWISNECHGEDSVLDLDLLVCPICYALPIQGMAECSECGRIFCDSDYRNFKGKHNSCPICKKSPFKILETPHILYRSIFDKIRFECQLCKDQQEKGQIKSLIMSDLLMSDSEQKEIEKQFEGFGLHKDKDKKSKERKNSHDSAKKRKIYTKKELFDHIVSAHKQTQIIDYQRIYDFTLIFNKKDPVALNFYENIELNHRLGQLRPNQPKIILFSVPESGEMVELDLEKEQILSLGGKKEIGKVISKLSKTIQSAKDYPVWEIELDYGFKFYSPTEQELFEKNYQDYQKNQMLNEFTFDIAEAGKHTKRYRVSFKHMTQINTFTNFSRMIKRTLVRFK